MSFRTHLTAGRLVLLAFAAAFLLTVAAGIARAANKQTAAGCGNKLVFLVWPHGHPAIPRIVEFPKIRNPHIELYRTFSSGYNVNLYGAYVIGGTPPAGIPRGDLAIACADYGTPLTKGEVAEPRLIKQQTAVKCVFTGSPVADVVPRTGGVADLYVHSGNQLLAHAHVTKSSAILTVPSGRCTLAAPPHA